MAAKERKEDDESSHDWSIVICPWRGAKELAGGGAVKTVMPGCMVWLEEWESFGFWHADFEIVEATCFAAAVDQTDQCGGR